MKAEVLSVLQTGCTNGRTDGSSALTANVGDRAALPLTRARAAWPLAALIVTVAVPLAVRGGFTARSRGLFVGLAGLSVAAVLVHDEPAVRRSVREPAILALLGLALLTLLSAAWTQGDAGDAVRWGLVIAAYAATALVAAQAARQEGLMAIAVAICALAALEAAIGLTAAGLRVEPYAERSGGSWRPGGTLEYPPALALIQVFALPIFLRGALARRRRLWLSSAAGVALAAGAIALADSRTEIALAVAVLGAAIAWPAPTVRASRGGAVLAGLLAVGAALATRLALGGYAFPGATGQDAGRLLLLGAIVPAPSARGASPDWFWSSGPVGAVRPARGLGASPRRLRRSQLSASPP